jgi:hypothetical protein
MTGLWRVTHCCMEVEDLSQPGCIQCPLRVHSRDEIEFNAKSIHRSVEHLVSVDAGFKLRRTPSTLHVSLLAN